TLKGHLTNEQLRLYTLVWQRFVASQMESALYDVTTAEIPVKNMLFRATGRVMRFNGYMAVYVEGKDEESDDEELRRLPDLAAGDPLDLLGIDPGQHFTEPPARYTEATLVKALEEKGIGRPSTYAQIISIIQNRSYVEKVEGRFKPTELGLVVNDVLVQNFDDLFNVSYTAEMEERLDEIEEGALKWQDALSEFYKKFTKDLKAAEENITKAREGVL